MKVLVGFLIGIAAVVVIAVLVLGYLGFVPGVSNVFGSNKPVKLGTTFALQDYQSAITKTGIKMNDNLANLAVLKSDKVYGPPMPVNVDFTPSEALAFLNLKPYPDKPVKDWQLRFNSDNSVEISGLVDIEKITNYALQYGASAENVQQALDIVKKIGVLTKELPIYAKGQVSVVNGQVNFNADNLKVGKLSIPTSQVNNRQNEINDILNKVEQRTTGFTVKNASIVSGKLHFEGTLPSTVSKR